MTDSYIRSLVQRSHMNSVEVEKAWHFLAILLRIGHPASLEELASRCDLFSASPDLVQYLCTIPDSPLYLMENGFVVVSMVAISAIRDLVCKGVIGWDILRTGIRVLEGHRFWNNDLRTYCRKRGRSDLDTVETSTAKRRLFSPSADEGLLALANRVSDAFSQEPVNAPNVMITNMSSLTVDSPTPKFEEYSNKKKADVPLLLDDAECSSFLLTSVGSLGTKNEVHRSIILNEDISRSIITTVPNDRLMTIETDSYILNPTPLDRDIPFNFDLNVCPPGSFADIGEENTLSDIRSGKKGGCSSTSFLLVEMQYNALPVESDIYDNHLPKVLLKEPKDAKTEMEFNVEEGLINDTKVFIDHLVDSDQLVVAEEAKRDCLELRSPIKLMSLEKETGKEDFQASSVVAEFSSCQKQPVKPCDKVKNVQKDILPPKQAGVRSLDHNRATNALKQLDQSKSGQKLVSNKQRLKNTQNHKMEAKDNFLGTSIAPKNRLENKGLPLFESFIIEEEEGSGGYGTVYRAMRKDDGKKFAIKCPHANAHRQHITNELKMLERFGGKNYVIKYEGSLKSGSNVCFILEHVPHDRPEVLKKEIDMYNLQWYGYCIFWALACLHKQGVMHRDVKPGNFLFSRKLNKGYLIDFNLALDLQQKHSIASKSKSSHHYASFEHVPVPQSKSASSSAKDEKFARSNTAISQVKAVDSKKNQEQDMNAKKTAHVGSLKNHPDPSGGNILRSQGADGSGITSTKDITSTRTHSRERMREPILCPVRKGFRSLVENVIQTSKHIKSPASQRKRVAALPSKADGKLLNPSPMPLHYGGLSITGAELLKSKENGKLKKEGSCVGTKGFRAPEVLFRSLHQGPKVDVWSAGVTLLYLMVGRSPFTGDPEQNIRDIAKLRGSEDLWEVAKLHNRESSFPVELLDIQSLSSTDLRSWCKTHTKRPEFFNLIPKSLFDLVDKCLTVNPRLRISAEEALKHEFFSPCHESLRKQRDLRRGLSLDSATVQIDPVHSQDQVPCEA